MCRVRLMALMCWLAVAGWCGSSVADSKLDFPAEPAAGTLFNALYRPPGNGPFPAIVLLHSCGGIGEFEYIWAEKFKSWGYVAVVVDSFSPRGEKIICGNWRVSVTQVASDAFAAIDRLRTMGFVKPDKIGVIGFSYGAWAATWMVSPKFAAKLNRANPGFGAAIALYTPCTKGEPPYRSPNSWNGLYDDISVPLQIITGSNDTETPASACESFVKSLASLGKPVSLTVIAGATHAFDNPYFAKPYYPPQSPGTVYLYSPEATEAATKLVKETFTKYLGGPP